MLKTIKQKAINGIRRDVNDCYGLKLPLKDICKVMNNLERKEPLFWEDEYFCESYTDTLPREIILNEIAETFLKTSWPDDRDNNKVINKFKTKLKEVAQKRNWTWK